MNPQSNRSHTRRSTGLLRTAALAALSVPVALALGTSAAQADDGSGLVDPPVVGPGGVTVPVPVVGPVKVPLPHTDNWGWE